MLDLRNTTTTTALLDGLHLDADGSVWREFDTRYRPIILGFCKKLGVAEEDAADVAQDALTRFVQDYRAGLYDRTRGRLRSWIIGIVRCRISDMRRKHATRREARGESAMLDLSAEPEWDALWEAERRQSLMRQAIDELRGTSRMKESTIRAFELYAMAGRPVAEVAAELHLTAGDIYMAKSNVAQRLREILQRLDDLFDDG